MEFPNPFPFMFFTSSSSLNITVWNLLNDHDGKVIHGVSTSIEVLSHCRFLCFHVSDVISVAVEADVQGILCHSNVLLAAPPALYQVHSALGLTGSRCAHLVGSFGDSTLERVGGLDVSASNTAFGVTWPVSIPDTFGDEDRHVHPYIPFFLLLFIWRKKRTHTN